MNRDLRFSILQRDGFRCVYCGTTAEQERLEVDHILPRANGGKDEPTNLVTACERCNRGKMANPLTKTPEHILTRLEIPLKKWGTKYKRVSQCPFTGEQLKKAREANPMTFEEERRYTRIHPGFLDDCCMDSRLLNRLRKGDWKRIMACYPEIKEAA